MKRILAFLLLLPMCLSSFAYAQELVIGSRGDDVLAVQQRLAELGYLSGGADGLYGQQTANAVMLFQAANELAETGTVNAATQEKLFSDAAQGDEIVLAQQRLIELGYLSGAADGIWGNMSAEALSHFQRVNGLNQTGEMDEQTAAVLFSDAAQRDNVMLAQRKLAEMGYYFGEVNGTADEATAQSIACYQRLNGLTVSGEVDEATLAQLETAQKRYSRLSGGSKGDAVIALQQALIDMGFLEGTADGAYGKMTVAAVEDFQAHLAAQGMSGVDISGAATALTQEYLFSAHYSSYLADVALNSEGSEAQRVERRLRLLGYMDAEADGIFDEYAVEALRSFQAAEGLNESGVADEATVSALFAADAAQAEAFVPHDIALGDSGEAVAQAQQALMRLGLSTDMPDGDYGEKMEAAFEALYDMLTATGNAHAEAFAARESVSIAAQELLQSGELFVYAPVGEEGDAETVKRIQRRLHTLYYMSANQVDGDYGAETQATVTVFQTNNGLEATGIADEATQRLLFSDDAKANKTKFKLEISIARQRVYAYELNENDEYELIHTFVCSTGLGNTTPKGIFVKTQPINRWHYFKKFKCWAQYSYQIDGDILFHSVLYDEKDTDTLRMGSVYALGSKASHGCVRLKPEDAKWIFTNCARGTIVEIY